jgi:hypothetical protein
MEGLGDGDPHAGAEEDVESGISTSMSGWMWMTEDAKKRLQTDANGHIRQRDNRRSH